MTSSFYNLDSIFWYFSSELRRLTNSFWNLHACFVRRTFQDYLLTQTCIGWRRKGYDIRTKNRFVSDRRIGVGGKKVLSLKITCRTFVGRVWNRIPLSVPTDAFRVRLKISEMYKTKVAYRVFKLENFFNVPCQVHCVSGYGNVVPKLFSKS